MMPKIRIRYAMVCCLLLFFTAFQATSMEEEQLPYLFDELKNENHDDPLFFELITKTKRRIIIIGSIHTVHPRILFSEAVYNLLRELSNHAILFTEHTSINKHLMPQAKEMHKEKTENLWKPNEFLTLDKDKRSQEIWDTIVKNEYKLIDDVPIASILQIERSRGIVLFYSFASDAYRKKFSGFETCLRSWKEKGKWHGDIQALEELDPFLQTFSQSSEPELKNIFTTSLNIYHKVLYSMEAAKQNSIEAEEKVKNVILNSIKKSIKTYCYEDFITSSEKDEPTKIRNKAWSKKILEFLVRPSQENTPIVIVCGADHLKGGIQQDSGSLLEFLWESKYFLHINRINKDGEQVKYAV